MDGTTTDDDARCGTPPGPGVVPGAGSRYPGGSGAGVPRSDLPWAAGEVVRLLVDLSSALRDEHAAGRGHGRLGEPGTWAVSPAGRAVLTGASSGSARPAGDVRDLARAALGLLGRLPGECLALPEDVVWIPPGGPSDADPEQQPGPGRSHGDDTVTALVPVVPGCADDDVPRERLRHVLLLATREEPASTGLELLVAQALAVADPVPLRCADAAVLARDALVRSAGELAPSARARHRRRGPARGGVLVPSLTGAAALLAGMVVLVALGQDGPAPAGAAAQGTDPAARVLATGLVGEPVPARVADPDAGLAGEVVVLTRTRATALARGDLLRLTGVTVPGSPAALADLTRAARRVGDARPADAPVPPVAVAGVDVRVDQVTVLPPDERGARVLLVAAVGERGPDVQARGVVLTVSQEGGRWRVRDVAPSDERAEE